MKDEVIHFHLIVIAGKSDKAMLPDVILYD
jgi:hypothetical protein